MEIHLKGHFVLHNCLLYFLYKIHINIIIYLCWIIILEIITITTIKIYALIKTDWLNSIFWNNYDKIWMNDLCYLTYLEQVVKKLN